MTTLLAPLPKLRFVDSNGNALAGGKLFVYAAGTTTKINSYIDSTGSTPNSNPIILDSRGECSMWMPLNTSYKITLSPSTDTDPPTNPIYTQDNMIVTSSLDDAYKDVPANTQTTSYILSLTDRGKCIETTAGVTVPPNSSVAFPAGATISIINTSSSPITITAGSGVTLELAGSGTPGNRTLGGYGMMTLRQTATINTWYCIGAGLS